MAVVSNVMCLLPNGPVLLSEASPPSIRLKVRKCVFWCFAAADASSLILAQAHLVSGASESAWNAATVTSGEIGCFHFNGGGAVYAKNPWNPN